MNKDHEMARVEQIDGQTVLVDPMGFAVMKAVAKYNCKNTFALNAERVQHFAKRIEERGLVSFEWVIVILNVEDAHGGPIAELLMPGFDWSEYRVRGEIPFARGLAGREGIGEVIAFFDPEAAEKLQSVNGTAVVVVDHGVAEIFPVEEA